MVKHYSKVTGVVRNWHWNQCHQVSELTLNKSYKDRSQGEHGHFWPPSSRMAQQKTPMFNTGLDRQTQEDSKRQRLEGDATQLVEQDTNSEDLARTR